MDDDIAEEIFETNIIETNVNDLCRICGGTSDSPLVSIYEDNGLDENLAGKIMLYLPIKISEDDVLPIKVCVNCANGVLTWHLLYECCAETDRKFQTMLSEGLLRPTKSNQNWKEPRNGIAVDENIIEASQEDECEMEDVMFLKAEFGPEDEQYLEDETRLADGENDPKNSETQATKCTHTTLFCYVCSQELENNDKSIEEHLVDATMDCYISCKECDIPPKQLYYCEICRRPFQTRSEMASHRSQHEEFYCKVCKKTFKKYSSYHTHKRKHEESTVVHSCPMCDYSSHRKYNVQLHVKSHVQDFACRICCKSFNSEQILENHKANHHKSELAGYDECTAKVYCGDCNEEFSSKFKLYFHTVKEHNNDDEKFICSKCNRIFETLTILRSHEKTHSQEYYRCMECNKTFSKLKNYTEHQNSHLDSRPFECNVCLQRFKYSSNLSQHKSIHKGVKNFSCHYCEKKFTRSNTLNVHLKSHRNERNFACDYCGCSFVQSSTLYKHIRALHKKCDLCDKVVGDLKQFRIHLWKDCPSYEQAGTEIKVDSGLEEVKNDSM